MIWFPKSEVERAERRTVEYVGGQELDVAALVAGFCVVEKRLPDVHGHDPFAALGQQQRQRPLRAADVEHGTGVIAVHQIGVESELILIRVKRVALDVAVPDLAHVIAIDLLNLRRPGRIENGALHAAPPRIRVRTARTA